MALTSLKEQHQHLLANCFGQSLTLMKGNTNSEAPHKNLPGNKPSNTLMLRELNPYNLGSLIALYEHKVFVQSVIWNINAFDQWGVELGKDMGNNVLAALEGNTSRVGFDSSTSGLVQAYKKMQNLL